MWEGGATLFQKISSILYYSWAGYAGDAVLWDARLPHMTDPVHHGKTTREVHLTNRTAY